MYGWYSKTQQQRILERKKREYPYVYYIDKQDKVIQFVAELGIDFPIMIGQSEAYDIMKTLGNEALTLPYTILIDEKGEVVWSKNTELMHSDMDEVLNIE